MRSISGRRRSDNALLACDTFKDDAEGQEYCLTRQCRCQRQEQIVRVRKLGIRGSGRPTFNRTETFNLILEEFKDDPEAILYFRAGQRHEENEITQEGLSENQYRATVRRIRMKLLSPTKGGGGGEKHDGQD